MTTYVLEFLVIMLIISIYLQDKTIKTLNSIIDQQRHAMKLQEEIIIEKFSN